MKYDLDVNGNCKRPDVSIRPENGAQVRMEDKTWDMNYRRINEHKIRLNINGRQMTAWVEKNHGESIVILNGQRYAILDNNARDQVGKAKAKSGAALEPDVVTPPMPAIVIQVPVSQGDTVEKGDTVVVISAMKMETALTAPYNGKITRIGVVQGDKVMPGDVLVDIEGSR